MEINNTVSKEDASKIIKIMSDISCSPEEIAYQIDEIQENTKIYIGEWNPAIAKNIPKSIPYIYESFPGSKILRTSIELGTKTGEEYKKAIEQNQIILGLETKNMLKSMQALPSNEKVELVSFSVAQLGFEGDATIAQIYTKARELGLELCPPQVGPELCLSYTGQPHNESFKIAMNLIVGSDNRQYLFWFGWHDDSLYLSCHFAAPYTLCHSNYKFVFRVRESES